jgi:pimeloyl-ACP methyl ester carboxylesterase
MAAEVVRADGVRVAYAVQGPEQGPWLTLVHGLTQDRRVWSAQQASLAAAYRLLSIDLRGHGASDAPEQGYGPVEYAGDVLAVLDALGVAATHFWGTHTGAGVGLLLAAEHPERVASLVLEGAVIPGVPVAAVEAEFARMRQVIAQQGLDAARAAWFDESPFFAAMRADPLCCRASEHRAMVLGFSGAPWLAGPGATVPDVVGRLGELRQPVVLINGVDDLPEFHETAARLTRDLRSVSRYVIPGTGAFPLWEYPDAVTPVVARFLEDVD